MSRCLPYPPPGFVDNAIKLQKEREIAKKLKKEEKKERKKAKKEREKAAHLVDSSEETRRHNKRKHRKDKSVEQRDADLRDADLNRHLHEPKHVKSFINLSQEQLERSSLSEEHGVPSNVRANCGSPESSQDSSKRRKILSAKPDQPTSGNIFRIKLPIGKPTGLDRNADTPAMLTRVSTCTANLEHPNKLDHVNSRAQNALGLHVGPSNAQYQESKILQSRPPTTLEMPRFPSQVGAQSEATIIRAARPTKQSEEPYVSERGQQLANPVIKEILQPEKFASDELCQIEKAVYEEQHNLETVNKGQQQTEVRSQKEEPCFSGRGTEVAPGLGLGQSSFDGSDGSEHNRRDSRSERKFKKMIGKFNPVPLHHEDTAHVGDQGWLFGTGKKSISCLNKQVADQRKSCQATSLQPRAVYMAELNVYQLPFVVPF